MFDLSIFLTPEAWISLITLIFLEIVLGVDNIVFIAVTTNRLPESKQHIGRKLGLLGAMFMRILFLCFASFLVHMTQPVFSADLGFWGHGFSVRDIVLGLGGAYLIYKGISELRGTLALNDLEAEQGGEEGKAKHLISLPRAVGTIMVMDVVFSIDSVITAVGLANHLIVMIIAVVTAVLLMMVFIDQVSDFINNHVEMKILALTFIMAIGVLLFLDGVGINSGIEVLDMHVEKLMVYFAMVFSFVLELLQMRYNKKAADWKAQHIDEALEAAIMQEESARAAADADDGAR
jgi:predicted tellurium resistance membrane protein TerC